MSPNIAMIVGGLIWFLGELWGVKRGSDKNTTSGFIWHLEARWPALKVLVGVFVVSLFGHFLFHTMLLP